MKDKAIFSTKCRNLWRKRQLFLRGRRNRSRCTTFNTVKDHIKKVLKGASNSLIWELATQRTKAIAAAWVAGLDKQSEEAQKISHELNQQYLSNLEKAANDPSSACTVDANTLTAQETQYLTAIQEGIHLMFMCRMPTCMFFGLNSAWVKHIIKEHFKCPLCGEQYKPFAGYKNAVQTAFMLQIVNPTTGDIERIPVTWPPSEEINVNS